MKKRWKQLREKYWPVRIYDQGQKKAFGNLLRFFALMLVLTLVARGTANAAVPQVQTSAPGKGTITQEVTVQGMISAAGSCVVECPQGLTVQTLLCKEGQAVEEGQALVQFDLDEVALALDRAKAELQKLQTQISQLEQGEELDDAAVANAQQQLNCAYEDQEKARQTLEALQAAQEPDEQAIEQARQAYESAVRASQTAENARNSALEDYEKQKQQNEKNALTNQADAAVLRVDIEEKQTEIYALEQLAETNGQITAPLAGTLTAWKLTEGTTSGTQACTLADAAQGYELEFTLSEIDAEHAQLGAQVQVVQKNQTQTAAVTAVGAPREDGSLTLTARLEGGDWKQGAATGTMTLSRTDYDLCVPAGAVHSDNRGTFVYVLEERDTVLGTQNVLLRVPVEVLENGRTQTAISSAILTAFDQVVASSTKPLSEGARVRVDAS